MSLASPAEPAAPASKGGVAVLVAPADSAFSFFPAPYPPQPPSPVGKGVTKVISCKGLRPLHPRGLNPWFAAKPTGIGSLRVVPSCTCMAGAVSAASGSVQGCRGRSPRRNKLWGSPFPAGEGGSGVYPSPSGKGGSKVN